MESKHDNDITVSVITGDNVTANFTFQHSGINSPSIILNLYKNDKKIGSCKQTNKNCSERFVISDVDDNYSATLYIINITSEDKGKYHIAVFVDGVKFIISSNEISFTVKPRDTTNGRFSFKLQCCFNANDIAKNIFIVRVKSYGFFFFFRKQHDIYA